MIHELLFEGPENAQTARELCSLLGIDHRTLTATIERERRAGLPICASSDTRSPGYFLAEDQETMRRYCARLDHREREIARTREACEATIDGLPARGA